MKEPIGESLTGISKASFPGGLGCRKTISTRTERAEARSTPESACQWHANHAKHIPCRLSGGITGWKPVAHFTGRPFKSQPEGFFDGTMRYIALAYRVLDSELTTRTVVPRGALSKNKRAPAEDIRMQPAEAG